MIDCNSLINVHNFCTKNNLSPEAVANYAKIVCLLQQANTFSRLNESMRVATEYIINNAKATRCNTEKSADERADATLILASFAKAARPKSTGMVYMEAPAKPLDFV